MLCREKPNRCWVYAVGKKKNIRILIDVFRLKNVSYRSLLTGLKMIQTRRSKHVEAFTDITGGRCSVVLNV